MDYRNRQYSCQIPSIQESEELTDLQASLNIAELIQREYFEEILCIFLHTPLDYYLSTSIEFRTRSKKWKLKMILNPLKDLSRTLKSQISMTHVFSFVEKLEDVYSTVNSNFKKMSSTNGTCHNHASFIILSVKGILAIADVAH